MVSLFEEAEKCLAEFVCVQPDRSISDGGGRKKEEGRGKKEGGRRKREEVRGTR